MKTTDSVKHNMLAASHLAIAILEVSFFGRKKTHFNTSLALALLIHNKQASLFAAK
jgi:hypothetical protein